MHDVDVDKAEVYLCDPGPLGQGLYPKAGPIWYYSKNMY